MQGTQQIERTSKQRVEPSEQDIVKFNRRIVERERQEKRNEDRRNKEKSWEA